MKSFRKVIIILLMMFLIAIAVPHKSEASGKYIYKITTLKQETWAKARKDTYSLDTGKFTIRLHKIKVPAKGYVKIEFKKEITELRVYEKIDQSRLDNTYLMNVYRGNGFVKYLVLPKGTYYIGPGLSKEGGFRWSFTKTTKPTNTTRLKAKVLVRGKKAKMVFHYDYKDTRWYRIDIKQTQDISFTLKEWTMPTYNAKLVMYDSKGEQIYRQTVDGNWNIQNVSQGTYYIKILYPGVKEFKNQIDRCMELSWK